MKKLLTVKELLDWIKEHGVPDEATISMEGCDCFGDASDLEYDSDEVELVMLR